LQGMEEMRMHLPGSFAGHMVPGVLFLVWVVFWLWELVRHPGTNGPASVKRYLLVKVGKVVFPLVGVQFELARSDSLYVSGPPTDGTGTVQSFIFFSWHVLAISATLLGVRAFRPSRS